MLASATSLTDEVPRYSAYEAIAEPALEDAADELNARPLVDLVASRFSGAPATIVAVGVTEATFEDAVGDQPRAGRGRRPRKQYPPVTSRDR